MTDIRMAHDERVHYNYCFSEDLLKLRFGQISGTDTHIKTNEWKTHGVNHVLLRVSCNRRKKSATQTISNHGIYEGHAGRGCTAA